jgi:heme exporter protein D
MDHYGPFVLSAFAITVVVLGGYAAYLRSRLSGLRRQEQAHSARNVATAVPIPTTAQTANSPSGSTRS